MRWSLNQKGWRGLAFKMALLTALWLIVTFVFATEFYFSALGMPLKLSWTDAAISAFRDWLPWMLLSPAVVLLAGRFGLERGTWQRNLMIHLAACCLFSLAYGVLSFLALSPMLAGPVSVMANGGAVGAVGPGFGVIRSEGDFPPGLPALPPGGSNSYGVGQNSFFIEGPGPVTATQGSNNVFVLAVNGNGILAPPPTEAVMGFQTFPVINRWTHFFHMTMSRTQFTVPIYWCIACICWVTNHFQEAGERERRTLELETRLSQANLQALKMQLQPHFLFNTLNAISSLIHENPRAADDMIGSLSHFLRTTLDVSSQNEVPLRKELEFVDRYLEIQQIRFGARLQIRRELDPSVMEALVPPLIFQPLVENAIRHGIESCETGGTVTVRASQAAGTLHLEICDDGGGAGTAQLLKPGNGVGLSNTKARLQELYGDRHQFALTVNQPIGACAHIEIPLRLSESNPQANSV
jgi:two-component sensor histidine kinase